MARHNTLPANLPPRGLNSVQAAEYLGISATTFENLVATGHVAPPKRVGKRKIWDVRKLDQFFDGMPDEEQANPWDAQGPQA